jgi:twitching motility protein PilI
MARRNRASLRQYQTAVAERLRNLAQLEASASSMLGFVAGDMRWVLNLHDVAEVMPVPAIMPIPLTRPYFNGVCNVRGNLFGVIDFSALIGRGAAPRAVENRLLLLPPALVQGAALLITRMAGLRNPENFVAIEREQDAPEWVARRFQDKEGTLWQELNVAGLARYEQFLNVGR